MAPFSPNPRALANRTVASTSEGTPNAVNNTVTTAPTSALNNLTTGETPALTRSPAQSNPIKAESVLNSTSVPDYQLKGNIFSRYINNGTVGTPFRGFSEKDPGGTNGRSEYQTITMQKEYSHFSLEELRVVDYAQGRGSGEGKLQQSHDEYNTRGHRLGMEQQLKLYVYVASLHLTLFEA